MNLNKLFLTHCKKNNLEVNLNQINLIEEINKFYNSNFDKSFIRKIFSKKDSKPGFYLQGDVGVGKTMILNFFYENLKYKKQRLHFNEFMINFHDFAFQNKKESVIDGQPQGNLTAYYGLVGKSVGYRLNMCDLLVWKVVGKYNGFAVEIKITPSLLR